MLRLVVFFVVLLVSSGALAQPADPADIGIYFDEAAILTATMSEPLETWSIFVVSTDVPAGQNGYEFLVDGDPRVTFIGETIFPERWNDFGADPAPNRKNYIVGTGGCHGFNTTAVLVQLDAMLLAPATDVLFCLEGASPSSYSPPRPGYVDCGLGENQVYGLAYEGCAVLNPLQLQPPVPMPPSSWGALKARFLNPRQPDALARTCGR